MASTLELWVGAEILVNDFGDLEELPLLGENPELKRLLTSRKCLSAYRTLLISAVIVAHTPFVTFRYNFASSTLSGENLACFFHLRKVTIRDKWSFYQIVTLNLVTFEGCPLRALHIAG